MEKTESFVLSQTEKYHKLIIKTYCRLEQEKFDKYLKPLFVMACSSGLEYFINSILIDYTIKEFPNYRAYAQSYITLNFNAKLLLVAPTVTNNRFIFNEDNGNFKTLKRLIGRRNEILHNKDFLNDKGIFVESEDDERTELRVEVNVLKKVLENQVDMIDTQECKDYMKAIDTFCSDFLFAYNLDNIQATGFLIDKQKQLANPMTKKIKMVTTDKE